MHCPGCGSALSFERILSDPWRQRVVGARHFKVRSGSLPYVLSCVGCLAAVELHVEGETGQRRVAVGGVLVRSLRILELARSLEHAQGWAVAQRMFSEPLEAELLGAPELFCRLQSGLGGFVRLIRKARVDMRRDPEGLLVPVGPRNLYAPDQIQHGPVLPVAFKLFPLGVRNGLLWVRPDRIRSTDGRQLPELVVPLEWVRLQPQSYEPQAPLPLPQVPERVVVEVEEEAEPCPAPVVASDAYALPEAVGIGGFSEEEEEEPASPRAAMASMLDSELDPETLDGWRDEDSGQEPTGWTATGEQSTRLATELSSDWLPLLSEHLGEPAQRYSDSDTRLPLTVHAFPSDQPGCVTLITDGMRRYKMPVVLEGAPRRLELCWTLSQDLVAGSDSWPVQLLMRLARMPMLSRSATWSGDVLGPMRPGLGQTGMRDVLLWPSGLLPGALSEPLTAQGRLQVLAVWPLGRTHAVSASLDGPEAVLAELRAQGRTEAFVQGGASSGD